MDVAICERYSKPFHGDKVQTGVINCIMLTAVPTAALRYKPEVRWVDSRWRYWKSVIDIILLDALLLCGRLSL